MKKINTCKTYFLQRKFFTKIFMVMKITVFFLLIAISSAFAKISYSQNTRFSLHLENVTIQQVFDEIQKKSEFIIFYKDNQVDLNHRSNVNIDDATVYQILDQALKSTNLGYRIIDRQIVILAVEAKESPSVIKTETKAEQKKEITGTVKDPNGISIPGVSVVVKGTTTGIVTDADGKFTLSVPADAKILVFSFVGMKTQEIVITGKTSVNIVIEEETVGLEEVVAIGYGTQRKINVTGSIMQINSKELKTATSGNLSSMLQGRLPGLITKQNSGQPGSDGASLLVRGMNTLGSNAPLVIVDGFERPFPDVNPDEIESITILKDATSAAVYGVRAGNGVILVTTKRGTNQKPTISVNSSVALSMNTNFPKFLNGPDYAYWFNKAQELDGVPEGSSNRWFTQDDIDRITNGDPQGIFGNTDWLDLLFKDYAPIYTNNISLNGGNDNVKYFVSLGSFNQNGIIDRTGYDRYNVRSNIDAQVLKNLSASFNLAISQSETKEPGLSAGMGNSYASIFSQALMSFPFLPAYSASGMPIGSFNPGNGNQNPLAARDFSGEQNNRSNRFQGSVSLKYDIPFVKGLNVKVNLGYDKGYSLKKTVLLPYLLYVYNVSTREYGETYARHTKSGEATINQWFSDSWTSTAQTSLNYDNKFGKHSLGALFLYEGVTTNGTSMSAGRKNFPIMDIMDLTYGEEVIDNLVKGGHSNFQRAGYVTRVNYAFDDRYLFEFTGRIDGSARLPQHNRWGFFPGVALGWRISNEPFFKDNISFVDNLKLRLSVGKLGNDNIGSNAYIRTMSMGANPVAMIGNNLSRSLNVDRVPNDNIKWETTTSYNIGLEANLWNGLLGIEADAFYMVTKDILQVQGGLMPPSMGGYYPTYLNSGTVDNRGYELALTHHNKVGQVNYNIRGNVSFARNKVIETTEDANVPSYLRKTGKPMNQKYGFVAEGLFQTQEEVDNSPVHGPTLPGDIKLKDLNGDGRITRDQDITVIGRSNTPEMMFGMNLGAEWKAFDLSILLQGAALSDVALSGLYADKGIEDNTFYTRPFYVNGNSPYYLIEESWRPDHPDAKYPRLGIQSRTNGGKSSSWWVLDGSYLRLKNIQIGYTIPSQLTKKINIEKIRFYISGGNLFTLDHLPYLDPEMPDVNQGYYPQQKVIEFGINLTF